MAAPDPTLRPSATPTTSARRQGLAALARGLACGLVVMVALAGCSIFLPRFTAPKLSVVGISLGRSDLLQQRMVVRMRVENPNDRDLPVEGLAYTFEVNGEELAHGVSNASFTVPARGEAEFDTSVTTNMATAVLRLIGRGSAPLNYRFSGKVQLSGGLIRSVPFDRSGVLDLH